MRSPMTIWGSLHVRPMCVPPGLSGGRGRLSLAASLQDFFRSFFGGASEPRQASLCLHPSLLRQLTNDIINQIERKVWEPPNRSPMASVREPKKRAPTRARQRTRDVNRYSRAPRAMGVALATVRRGKVAMSTLGTRCGSCGSMPCMQCQWIVKRV